VYTCPLARTGSVQFAFRRMPLELISSWSAPHDRMTLGASDLHVWRAALNVEPATADRLGALLSADERAHARRFYFDRDRLHYAAARGVLRALTGRYLGIAPAAVAFRYGSHGKPYVDAGLSFNLSHSHGLALYAFARQGDIGIDVERINPEFNVEEIAANFFTPGEVADIRAQPGGLRHERFFDFWTRKEAYIKARAKGLSIPLNEFEVLDRDSIGAWSVYALDAGSGFAAALVSAVPPDSLYCFDWDGTYGLAL
ncbi:MAG: 4'-phosphopantetheinyl transferase family protein, partial [Bryobacteraceae bacterium]